MLRQVRHDRRADERAEIADHVHEPGHRARIAMADIDAGGPARRHREVLQEGSDAQRRHREPGLPRRQREKEENAAETVGDGALSGASPARPEPAHQCICQKAAAQAGDAAEKQRRARGNLQRAAA